MLIPWRAAWCRLGWTWGEMHFVSQHKHPIPSPVGVCTRFTAPAPRGAFCQVTALSKPAPFLPLFKPPPSPRLVGGFSKP